MYTSVIYSSHVLVSYFKIFLKYLKWNNLFSAKLYVKLHVYDALFHHSDSLKSL